MLNIRLWSLQKWSGGAGGPGHRSFSFQTGVGVVGLWGFRRWSIAGMTGASDERLGSFFTWVFSASVPLLLPSRRCSRKCSNHLYAPISIGWSLR